MASVTGADDLFDAQTIWNYMKLNKEYRKSDVILCLCSYDIRVAEKAAELWREGMGKIVLFSRKTGKLTEGLWNKPEEEVFKDRAVECGVPATSILVETESTNTGENIRFSYQLLHDRQLLPESVIIVQKPFMERRAYATFMKQWPGNIGHMTVFVTSPDVDLIDYPNEAIGDLNYNITVMVGDFARIRMYEEKGFQIHQTIPDNVQDAFERLVNSGRYTNHLPG